MKHQLVLLLCLMVCLPAFAPPPTEAEMREAIKKYDAESRKKVEDIFNAWVAEGSELSLRLAQKYLLPPVAFEPAVGSSVRKVFVETVLEKKVTGLYAAALSTVRQEFNEQPVHNAVVDALAVEVGKNGSLAAKLLAGAPEIKLSGLANGTVLSVRPTHESKVLTEALFKNGQLGAMKRVAFGGRIGSLDFAESYLNIANLPQAIASAGNDPSKLKILMDVRETLTASTVPTREEFTERMVSLMESQPPELRLKMAQAARDHLVKDLQDGGSSAPALRRTLTLNMYDSADLHLARYLMNQPVTATAPGDPKAPKLTGLRDVEMITYNGPRELKTETDRKTRQRVVKPDWQTVRYHVHNQVFDIDGRRISDQLDPKNYAPALRNSEEPQHHKSAVWRTDAWLNETSSFQRSWPLGSASDTAGCPLDQVAPGVATQK